MTIAAVSEPIEAISGSSTFKDFAKIGLLLLSLAAAFKAIDYFAVTTADFDSTSLDNESDDSYFEDRDVYQINTPDLSMEKMKMISEKSLINNSGVWKGEGSEGFFIDEDGNDWYFKNRQPG